MPPPSKTDHLPSSHPAHRQRPKSPNRVLAEAEAQWIFTDAELLNTPSIQDGMPAAEEKETRAKGVNFIVQVGIMLKLPQLTLSTAAIFFQRFLMRASLKKARGDIPKLHHYQIAATALFLATKVEESCRKIRELILAFCRVAQKNQNLVIDEQSKDWWRWRDCILYNEDVVMETLCFDFTVESPHRQLFEMLKYYGIEHQKKLRNAAWAFVTDAGNTQLCLLCSSRTIAVAGLYAACRYCDIALPDDSKGRPWWEMQHVRLKDIRKAVEYMTSNYEAAANKVNGVSSASGAGGGSEGERSIYVGLSTPAVAVNGDGADDGWDSTRLRDFEQGASPFVPLPESERRLSNASSMGEKRKRDDAVAVNGEAKNGVANGVDKATDGQQQDSKRQRLDDAKIDGVPFVAQDVKGDHDLKHAEEVLRVENGNEHNAADAKAAESKDAVVEPPVKIDDGKDEGEVEEGEVEE
jgi:protein BUR2